MPNTGNTQQQINYGAAVNDGTGDPLRTAFAKTDDNFDNVWLAGPVGSNITIANNTVQVNNTNGNLVLSPNGVGVVQTNNRVVPRLNNTYDLGTANLTYRSAYIGTGGLSVTGNLSANNVAITGGLDLAGDIVVEGNLTVEGDTIQIGNIVTDTKTIQLSNTAASAAAADGSGITAGANDDIATLLYNSSSNAWTTNIGIIVTGNVSATYFVGNASGLTSITGANVTGTVANAAYAVLSESAVSVPAGNITGLSNVATTGSYNDLTDIPTIPTATSNLTNDSGFITAATANVVSVNGQTGAVTLSIPIATSNLTNDSGFITASVTGNFDATGNITANYFIGDGSQLTGLPESYGNADVATFLSNYGSNTISTSGNVTAGNVSTGANLNFTGAQATDTARIFADVSGTTTSLVLEVGDDDASDSIVLRHYSFDAGTTLDMLTAQRSSNTQSTVTVTGNVIATNQVTATGNVTGDYFIGNGSQLTGIAASYGNANVATFLAAYGSNTVVTTGNITGGNLISSATIYGNVDVVLGNIANASSTKTRMVTDTTFSYIQTGNGTVGTTGNIVFSPYQDTVQRVVIDTSTGNVTAAGNITAQNFIGNISITGNVVGTSANVDLVAGGNTWSFDNTGNLVLPGNTFAVNYANNTPVDVVTRFESFWTVPVGNSTQSFTVSSDETYYMWVDCNIPNGILTWNATATITNTNVPVVGAQYAWVYDGGGTPIDFTSIPNQFVGTANTIVRSSVAPSATTNRFDFGINNASGSEQIVRYGWIQIS